MNLKDLGIPDDGYLTVVVYDKKGQLPQEFPFFQLPAYVRAGDISEDDQQQIAGAFKSSAHGFPYVSYHELPEFWFESIDLKALADRPPTPGNPYTVYGVVEVKILVSQKLENKDVNSIG